MAEQNIIEVVIKSVDQMGQGVRSATSSLKTLEAAIEKTNKQTVDLGLGSQRATAGVKQLAPTLDQAAASATAAGVAVGITAKAASALGLAIGGIVGVAIGGLLISTVQQWATAFYTWAESLIFANARLEELGKAIRLLDISAIAPKVKEAADALDKEKQKLIEAESILDRLKALAAEGLPVPEADFNRVNKLIGKVTTSVSEASAELEKYKASLEIVSDRQAAAKLPDLTSRVNQERLLIGLNETQRIQMEASIRLQQALKDINDENLTAEQRANVAAVQAQFQALATAKANELVTNTTRAFTAGIDQQIRALNAEVIALQQGEAAARRYVDAQQALETKRRTGVTVDPRQIEAKNVELDAATQKNLAAKREAAAISAREKADDQDRLETTELTAETWRQIIAQRTAFITGPLSVELTQQQGAVELAQLRLQVAQSIEAPAGTLLELSRQLDTVQQQIYATQIKQLQALAAQAEAMGNLIEAERLRAQAATLSEKATLTQNANLRGVTQDVNRQAESLADSWATSFTDKLISAMEGKKTSISDMFASFGRDIVSGFLKSSLSALLQGPAAGALGAIGPNAKKFGAGGSIFDLIFGNTSTGRPSGVEGPLLESGAFHSAGTALDQLIASTRGSVNALDLLGLGANNMLNVFSAVGSGLLSLFGALGQGISALLASLSGLSGAGGGGGVLSLIGGLFSLGGGGNWSGAITGGGFDAWDMGGFAKGGLVVGGNQQIPLNALRGVPRFARGGVVRGPVLGLLGEGGEDEFIIPRSKMPKNDHHHSTQVIIEGDITPRRPEMTPDEVIRIVASNGVRTRDTGIGAMVRTIIKREK